MATNTDNLKKHLIKILKEDNFKYKEIVDIKGFDSNCGGEGPTTLSFSYRKENDGMLRFKTINTTRLFQYLFNTLK